MLSSLLGSSKTEWKYDDLPTPQTEKEYTQLSRSVLKERKRIIDSAGSEWTTVREAVEYDDVCIEKKPFQGSDIEIIRVTGFVKLEKGKTIDDLAMQLYRPTFAQRKALQPSIIEYKKIKTVSDNIHVSRTVGQKTGITNREFIALRTYEKTADGYLIGIQSINDKEHPFDPNCVRATNASGTELSMVTDSIVQIVSVDHIDPKGWIPAMIINSYVDSAGDWIKTL